MVEFILVALLLIVLIVALRHAHGQQAKIDELQEHLTRERYRAELFADRSRDQSLEIKRLRFQLESAPQR